MEPGDRGGCSLTELAMLVQGQCVLDPFAGSGRLLQACAAVGASYAVACEVTPHRVSPSAASACSVEEGGKAVHPEPASRGCMDEL